MKSKGGKDSRKVNLLDVTLREGAYILPVPIPLKEVGVLGEYLEAANIQFLEAVTINRDQQAPNWEESIEILRQKAPKLKLGGLLIACQFLTEEDFPTSLDFVRIGVHCHEIDQVKKLVQMSKKRGTQTFVQLLRSPLFTPKKIALAAKKAESFGADVVYVVDSMGSLTPKKVREYIGEVKEKVVIPVGFHAHDNLSLAVANAVEAVHAGAEWIDASLLGAGRQAGNTQLEVLALLLEREGVSTEVDHRFLLKIAETLAAPLFRGNRGVRPYDVWTGFNNVDLYPEQAYTKMAFLTGVEIQELVEEIGRIKSFITLNDEGLYVLAQRFNLTYFELADGLNKQLNQ